MSNLQIVVLDGFTLNPGDITWGAIEELGDLVVHERSGRQARERASNADIVLTNKDQIDADLLADLPNLKYISVLATGTNVVDLQAARARGIPVSNVPGYGAPAVAQHVFALLLEMVNHTSAISRAVSQGRWAECPDFSFTIDTMTELDGKVMGIVGVGAIGSRVARIANGFGMRVVAAHQQSMDRVQIDGVPIEWMSCDDLFRQSDVITLHCPLTPETDKLVNDHRLSLVSPKSYLINTGRGGLVDEAALQSALKENRLAGAALDVLSVEPPTAGNPLIGAPRCIVTPHVAWATREARLRLMQVTAENIRAFTHGKPQNVVN